VHFFRGDRLHETIIRLGADQRYGIEALPAPNALQSEIQASWLASGRTAFREKTIV
jgi:hypothetical protein